MSEDNKQTIEQFIDKYKLSATSEVAYSNPYMPNSEDMNHYKVTIHTDGRYSGHSMDVTFSMGRGILGGPELKDILDCMSSDSAGLENSRDFEDWASNYGYDPDSRKAEKTYKSVVQQKQKLASFLEFCSPTAYEELLWETENL